MGARGRWVEGAAPGPGREIYKGGDDKTEVLADQTLQCKPSAHPKCIRVKFSVKKEREKERKRGSRDVGRYETVFDLVLATIDENR